MQDMEIPTRDMHNPRRVGLLNTGRDVIPRSLESAVLHPRRGDSDRCRVELHMHGPGQGTEPPICRGSGVDPRPPANRGWGWGWTPDPRQIGGGTPTPTPGEIGGGGGGGDRRNQRRHRTLPAFAD
jgi:hypothetical protein